jgi:hypothetical protein
VRDKKEKQVDWEQLNLGLVTRKKSRASTAAGGRQRAAFVPRFRALGSIIDVSSCVELRSPPPPSKEEEEEEKEEEEEWARLGGVKVGGQVKITGKNGREILVKESGKNAKHERLKKLAAEKAAREGVKVAHSIVRINIGTFPHDEPDMNNEKATVVKPFLDGCAEVRCLGSSVEGLGLGALSSSLSSTGAPR